MKQLRGPRAGYTLIEIGIAMSIFGGIFSSIALATITASDSHRTGSARAELDSRAQRVLNRIVSRVAQVGRDQLDPLPITPDFTEALSFRDPADFLDGAVVWSGEEQLLWEMEPNEIDNGLDDDSDGLIDEGRIVWVENPGTVDERRVVWTRNVREFLEGETFNGLDDNGNGLIDEQGLSFDLTGDVLRVLVTLERLDGEGRTMTCTAQTSVRLRN